MTEYGRGPGSEPWHPNDPLYGDQGWNGQQQQQQQWAQQPGDPAQYPADPSQYPGQTPGGQAPYGPQVPGGQLPYPGQAPGDPAAYGVPSPDGHQSYPGQAPGGPAPYGVPSPGGQQPYPGQAPGDPAAYGGQDPYQQQYMGQQGHYPQQQAAAYPGHGAQHQGGQHPGAQSQNGQDPSYHGGNGGWDTGQQTAMSYGGTVTDGYGGTPGQQGASEADYYATPDAYPPPEPPHRRRPEPEPEAEPRPPESADQDPDPADDHAFFGGDGGDGGEGDDSGGEPAAGGGRARRGKGKGKKKSRNGVACLVVSVVLVGALGGVGYFGYQFWEGRFGEPADYAGAGSGSTEVEVPKNVGLLEIGDILKKAGVVKSAGAFVSAADGKSIQAGVYVLAKEMSGREAVKLMLDPKSRNNLILAPGQRNAAVYKEIDKRLAIKPGTTALVAKAKAKTMGLPAWANDNTKIKDPLEGFLYPGTYPIAKGMKPEAVLRKMVAEAAREFHQADIAAQAQKLGLDSPLQVLTVASLVQAEGKFKEDFDKVARVIYNRLKPDNDETAGRLEFDSTVNYFKGQSTLAIGAVDKVRQYPDPYNTYRYQGLPPGPIGNPGVEAFDSSLNPEPGPWYYFVSVTENETVFSETHDEHERARQRYLEEQEKNGQ
ncbi:endolytic transglycosylase MltG [Streptomyces sp. NPDC057638]|uniref:endolytic transglycosylase MltG n=1 Tax=Streptomyces sp. NPDC057638 TaxID=3346190 RepID=UPI0036844385